MASRTAEQHVPVAMLRASWERMAFLHWPVAADRIQALLPSRLTVDTYDGSAWLGLTPFVMANVRPVGVPRLSGWPRIVPDVPWKRRVADLSSTPETNLRTYVRGPDGRDGVWFLTLHIGSVALATFLRRTIGAPYHPARLTVESREDGYTYGGRRDENGESYRLEVEAGDSIAPSDLEIWLTSRWRAYTVNFGRLLEIPVEHEPWPLRAARLSACEQTLTDCAGLGNLAQPIVHYSDGVRRVRIGPPAIVGTEPGWWGPRSYG